MNQARLSLGFALSLLAGAAGADVVKLAGKPAFRAVDVTGLQDGRLVFRGVSRQFLRKPLDQIEWIELDRVPALAEAEHARAGGRWPTAIDAYRAVLLDSSEPWLTDLARLRLVEAYDQAGHFDQAVGLYVDLLAANTRSVVPRAPRRPGPPDSPRNRAARQRLEAALASLRTRSAAARLRNLLLEIVLYDDPERWPATLPLPDARWGALATVPASQPVGRLPASTPTAGPQLDTLPAPRLPADSFALAAARTALAAGNHSRAVRLLERALPFIEPKERARWQVLLGRGRIALGQYARAADVLVQVAETDPDPARAAEALYYVGLAHERLHQPEVAAELYRELLEREDIPAEVRARARAGLSRVGE